MTLLEIIKKFPQVADIPDKIKAAIEAGIAEWRAQAEKLPEPEKSQLLAKADAWEALVAGASAPQVVANSWEEIRLAWSTKQSPIVPDPSDGQ